MVRMNIPEELPECRLLSILAKKVSQRHDTHFNFFGILEDFRQRISGEVRYINQLFPEYTPHDEQYHLKRLFHVADTILGSGLEEMNSAELFVLAIALYGHDWGMAVGQLEKKYILSGKLPKGTKRDDFWILSNERDFLSRFARENRITMDAESCFEELPVEIWREYVRQTHAFRSGERVRRYFEPISRGIGEAASRVCEGHWLDFEDLQDYRLYPPDFAVLHETVNLRALAVYLRLVDLLDLGEDRTPYVIWKFVAPVDPRSKMEWEKHRALQPVTCPPYQDGRIIQVDGSTENHEVYAALEDLRIWCEEQLRGCNDILARMNDPRHKLDLYHISWRVAPRGFRPISIQFEFNRKRMFEILSDEIYQGDPYVFLRELLQNSIDAIRMRREVLKQKGITPRDVGVIRVNVEHGSSGNACITWTDDGIGMDEYIVRNYLAIAGRSYYDSEDFRREGLDMDPISRFGVGILSCFMVANHVEIETFKDPYLPPQSEPLRIEIPDTRRQFRIEARPREGAKIGTTIRVFVEGRKLSMDEENNPVPLDVTRYLSIVAGFVQFPIIITEGKDKMIILHPKQDAEAVRQRFGEEFGVHQISLDYLWSEVFLPQDLPTAHEIFSEKRLDIAYDLDLGDYDGTLTYFVPINEEIDLRCDFFQGIEAIMQDQTEQGIKTVRWTSGWEDHNLYDAVGISRSGERPRTYAVYRDGILVPRAPPPRVFWQRGLPVPSLVVNIPKVDTPKLDLARRQLLGQNEHWVLPIVERHFRYLCEISLEDLLKLNPVDRFYQLCRLIVFNRLGFERLWHVFLHDHWPLCFLEEGGSINVLEWQELESGLLYFFPRSLVYELTKLIQCQFFFRKEYSGPLTRWAGDRAVVSCVRRDTIISLEASPALSLLPILRSHLPASIRFLQPPWKGDPPLSQEIYVPAEIPDELPDIEIVLEKTVEDPTTLSLIERAQLNEHGRFSYNVSEFLQPFEHSFAYGEKMLNLKHPFTQALCRFDAALKLSRKHETLPPDQLGQLMDARLSFNLEDIFSDKKEWPKKLHDMWSLAEEMELMDVDEARDLMLTSDDLILGSDRIHQEKQLTTLRKVQSIRSFGKPIT